MAPRHCRLRQRRRRRCRHHRPTHPRPLHRCSRAVAAAAAAAAFTRKQLYSRARWLPPRTARSCCRRGRVLMVSAAFIIRSH